MFRYLIDIFCKDTTIGLCQIERNKKNRIFKNKYSNTLFNKKYNNNYFFNSFTIDQTAYRL